MGTGSPPTDSRSARMEVLIGDILLAGVLISAFLIIAGLLWDWQTTGNLDLNYRLSGTNLLAFVVAAAGQFLSPGERGQALVSLGVGVLLLTPFARVLASVLFFAFGERNWKYTVFTAMVLAILTYSLF